MEPGAVVTPRDLVLDLGSSHFQTTLETQEEFSWNMELNCEQLNIVDHGLQWPFYDEEDKENHLLWQTDGVTGDSGASTETSTGRILTGPSSPAEDGRLGVAGSDHSSNRKIPAKKKTKVVFSVDQLKSLRANFKRQKYLRPTELQSVAAEVGLTYQQVKRWFQNQRMKFKRQGEASRWEAQTFPPHPHYPPPPLGQFNGSYNLNCSGNCCYNPGGYNPGDYNPGDYNPGDYNTWSLSGFSM